MGSIYLQPDEYAAFGVSGTTAAKVGEASVYVDSHLRRPSGLVWTPGADGNPAYMAAAVPTFELTLLADVAPGTSVPVTVTGPLGAMNVGDAVVADRATTTATEAVTVTAKAGNVLTLGNVAYPHAAGTLLEAGLMLKERRSPPKNRPIVRMMQHPLVRVVAGRGRYAYPRRGDAHSGNTDDFNLLAVYNTFGGPPFWEQVNPAAMEFDPATAQLWIPAGIMLAYYTEIEVTYIAGYSQASLPSPVKEACAKLIKALANDPDLGPVKSYRAGDTAIEKFADTIISGDVAEMLKPYRTRSFA